MLAGVTTSGDFETLRRTLESYFRKTLSYVPKVHAEYAQSFLHPGASGVYRMGNDMVARFGKVHPSVATAFEVPENTLYYEIEYEAILAKTTDSETLFHPISRFPTIARELNFILPETTPTGDIATIIDTVHPWITHVIVDSIYQDVERVGGRINTEFFMNFPSRRAENAGILSAWVGSLAVMIVTASVAVPIGVAAGIYLEEYARRNLMTDIIEINISNLAGVPSIIYGLLALGIFVYTFGLGQSIQTAGLTLALLILPVVIVATREAIRSIPQHIREGAYAMGSTRLHTAIHVVVPAAISGLAASYILGISRAVGETMILSTH